MQLKAMLWKEVKDLSRDRKTIFTAVFLPAFMLPLMAQLLVIAQKSSPVVVVVVNLDRGADVPAFVLQPLPLEAGGVQRVNLGLQVAKMIEESVLKVSPTARVLVLNSTKDVPYYNVLVVIPPDFSQKLLTLNPERFNRTRVEVYYRAGPGGLGIGATTIYQTIVTVLNYLSTQVFAKQRVEILLACCEVSGVPPEAVLSPIEVKTEYVSVTGQRISAAQLGKMLSAKLLLFSIFYVTVPVLAFVSDSVAGEKERKTLETLLASPIKRRNIVLGKFGAALVLGLIAAVADMAGLIAYIQIINTQMSVAQMGSMAFQLTLDPWIVLLHGLVMLLVIAATAAMLMPLVSLTDSVRSAQSVGGVVQMIPLLVILYAMYADITTVPMPWGALVYAIPHTYAVLAIDQALKGSWLGVVQSSLTMIGITAALIWVTIKIFESEVLVTSAFSFGRRRR
ncbi:MAG: ABC transporter permease [Crenarchaeota archaeon]|nr:ABC transporter permease [Thermoproteota archaeon]